jgi:uncharacterized protein
MKLISVKNLLQAEIGTTEVFSMEEDISKLDLPEEMEGHILSVTGKVMRLDDSVAVHGTANVSLTLICDRCLDNFDTSVKFNFDREYILDRKEKNEEDLYVDKYLNVDLGEELRAEIILAVPTQNICKEICGGLCLGCGLNLNHETCKCNNKEAKTEE